MESSAYESVPDLAYLDLGLVAQCDDNFLIRRPT